MGSPDRTAPPAPGDERPEAVAHHADWVTPAARAAADLGPAASDLVVQQIVTAVPGPDGSAPTVAAFHLRIGPDGAQVEAGYAPDAQVTVTEDVDTALAIRRGETSAQAAFMLGRLRVEGDLQRLAAQGRVLTERSPTSGAGR